LPTALLAWNEIEGRIVLDARPVGKVTIQ
jgi:hypothetical protein